jgi:hypothetical protein
MLTKRHHNKQTTTTNKQTTTTTSTSTTTNKIYMKRITMKFEKTRHSIRMRQLLILALTLLQIISVSCLDVPMKIAERPLMAPKK